jgi:hypothetical protein
MAITEFAIVSLKPGVEYSDTGFQDCLRSCTRILLFTDGATNFQFLRQISPISTRDRDVVDRICLLGGWQSVKQHDTFLASGEAAELMDSLSQYIDMEVVHHIDNDRRDVLSHKGGVDVDVFVVKKGKKSEFDRVVNERGEIGGWKLGKENIVGLTEEQKERMKQASAEGSKVSEESEIWVGFSNQKTRDEAAELRELVEELVEGVEVLQFGMLK